MPQTTLKLFAALALLASCSVCAADTFEDRLQKHEKAELKYGDVAGGMLQLPHRSCGGDVPLYWANGGVETKKGSLYDKLGLKLKLVDGDNYYKQVIDYVGGKSPFVRGSLGMLTRASGALEKDDRARPVVFLQLSWSAGDHLVVRSNVTSLRSLKGKRIALQQDGPHVGMLDDLLRSADLKWSDVKVVWTKQAGGKGGPAGTFRADARIDACLVHAPEALALTGGADEVGDGSDNTVKGARTLVSTAIMTRSIAEVCAIRKDYFEANKQTVQKLTAGYLQATHEIRQWQIAAKKDKGAAARYREVLELTREVCGKRRLPTLEDADRLVGDALLVGLPGNRAFFVDEGNKSGLAARQKPADFAAAGFDYRAIARLAGLPESLADQRPRPLASAAVQKKHLVGFEIAFEPNDAGLAEQKAATDFTRAIELASLFGNAVIHVRGHADTTKLVEEFIEAATKKKLLSPKEGREYVYQLEGGGTISFDNPASMRQIIEVIKKESLEQPASTLKLCDDLARDRARKVHQALLAYAEKQKLTCDARRFEAVGVGVLEPIWVRPRSPEDTKRNRRVEIRLYPSQAAPLADDDAMLYPY